MLLGISKDTVEAQRKFKEKFNLPFTLLADPDMAVIKAFGVLKDKTLYGKLVKGVQRSTFIVGPDGVVAKTFPDVKAAGHAEEILAALRG